jgi:hypothetical protein
METDALRTGEGHVHLAAIEAALTNGGRRHVEITALAAVDVDLAGTTNARVTTPEYADFPDFDCPAAADDAGMLALVRAAMVRLLAECDPDSAGDDPATHFSRAWVTILADDGLNAVDRLATIEWNRDDPDRSLVLTTHSPPHDQAEGTAAAIYAQLWSP